MSTEARIVSPQQKIGSRPTGTAGAGDAAKEPKKRGKKKLITVIIAVMVAAGAAYWFLAGPGAGASDGEASAVVEAAPEPVLGEVLPIDPISVNLAGGHFLRLGFALQLVEGAGTHGPIDSSMALDAAIAMFSGHSQEQLADLAYREDLKRQLEQELFERYHEEVVAVYYTDFVTQ